ncbi:glycoside hydrolase family 15 protein [Novosphingobium sp. PY1]|uniref:glycoside hydrolase family 15 protein n=1 Tax=Novosphingobium sp. PY1 TaxID=1882221 RepID=UPI001A8CDDD4|nr:glycoside hydrolase family 15 protein [Novosphingobium sp. PY1]GFM30706.1 putative glycoside hydrolase, family 15 [Novosphingobium sp. PY1]
MSQRRIDDYAIIADGETGALINRDATIEWLCFPRFDSEACFAALVGNQENGCWKLGPDHNVQARSRRYRKDTLILETEFEIDTGKVRITDFMPIRGEAPDIVRIVEGLSGEVALTSELILRFDYGRLHPRVTKQDGGQALAIAGPNAVSLNFGTEIDFNDRRLINRFKVAEGQKTTFVLTWFASNHEPPCQVDPEQALVETEDTWREWTDRIEYTGKYREAIIRSLITLKALVHRPTGGIVAAVSSSLPEREGGKRNWDYRYCWLRDATFTLLALTRVGLRKEAKDWIAWLQRAVCGDPIELQPFFGVDGCRRTPEWHADWLEGFNGAQPVRIGNGAAHQLQLDIFGEVIDALFQAFHTEDINPENQGGHLISRLIDKLENVWEQPDAGIWESRGKPVHHTYSKVMCWVGFDRASVWLEKHDKSRSERYRNLANRVRDMVLERGFNSERNTFTAEFDGQRLDAALLRLPLVGFIAADDPRMAGTVSAIEQHLIINGLVCRYRPQETDDGVGGSEGAFVAACLWLAEVYHLQGRKDDAERLFERILARGNDLHLFSEELSLKGNPRQLGNFPQALSHVALVNAARRLFLDEEESQERKARKETAA